MKVIAIELQTIIFVLFLVAYIFAHSKTKRRINTSFCFSKITRYCYQIILMHLYEKKFFYKIPHSIQTIEY